MVDGVTLFLPNVFIGSLDTVPFSSVRVLTFVSSERAPHLGSVVSITGPAFLGGSTYQSPFSLEKAVLPRLFQGNRGSIPDVLRAGAASGVCWDSLELGSVPLWQVVSTARAGLLLYHLVAVAPM